MITVVLLVVVHLAIVMALVGISKARAKHLLDSIDFRARYGTLVEKLTLKNWVSVYWNMH